MLKRFNPFVRFMQELGQRGRSTRTSRLNLEHLEDRWVPVFTNPSITTMQQPATAVVGSTIADTATVAGGVSPTGTVTFSLYNNATASGTALFTDTEPLGVNEMATSKGYVATTTGTDYWVATYSGDTHNPGATSGPADEPVVITPASPSIKTTQQPATATVGTSISDIATVSGGDNPTGTVTFSLYNNASASGTPLYTDADEPLTSGVATAKGYTATATGTDYWVATYNGDSNNSPVTSGATDEPVVITTTSNPGISIVKLTDGVNDPNPNGSNVPQLVPGSTVTWTYLVTNTGNVPFPVADVVVTDNQPGVNPKPELNSSGFIVGDTNDNNILDPGETWTYIATGTVVNLSNPPPGVTTVPITSGGGSGGGGSYISNLLGPAADYAVVAPNGFSINGPGTINGNVASGNNTVITSPAVINGTVYYSGSVPSTNATITGGVQSANLSQVFSDAVNASTTAFALSPTQSYGNIMNSFTINGNGGTNVIDLTGINLSNGVLTLNGSASDIFILNVNGSINSSNSNIAISGGVIPSNVLINVSGSVTITGGGPNNFYGTILDPTGAVNVHDKLLTGELIGNTIVDTSGFSINSPPVPPPPPPPFAYQNTGTVTVKITGTTLTDSYVSNYVDAPSGASPQLAVAKVADSSTVVAGQLAGFTVTISNTGGTITDSGVTLSDLLPAGAGADINWTIDTSGTGLGSGTTPADFQITGSVGSQSLSLSPSFIVSLGDSLAPGQSISVHITGVTSSADSGSSLETALGAADTYAALFEGANNQTLQVQNSTIAGNLGVGGTGKAQINGNSGTISGALNFAAANTNQYQPPNSASNAPSSVNYGVTAVTTALNAVNSLSSSLANLGSSLTINGTQTIDESAGQLDTVGGVAYRVFNVTNYNVNNNQSVTIVGDGSGDPVVFDFSGNGGNNLGGSVILSGGLTDDQVLWNFTGNNPNVQLNNNPSTPPFQGIILVPNGQININNSTLDGRVFGGGQNNLQIQNSTIDAPLAGGTLVNTATVSATGVSAQLAASTVTVGTGGVVAQLATGSTSTAGVGVGEIIGSSQLHLGTITVAVDLPAGGPIAAEQAAIVNTLTNLNSELSALGVQLQEVSGSAATAAQVHIQFASTSAIGGQDQGVLGAYSPDGQITLISGWNWFYGSSATGISSNQYDFETVLTHELGHVLGLGENSNPSSAMSLYLSPGQVRRDLTTTDLTAIAQELGEVGVALGSTSPTSGPGGTSTAASYLPPSVQQSNSTSISAIASTINAPIDLEPISLQTIGAPTTKPSTGEGTVGTLENVSAVVGFWDFDLA